MKTEINGLLREKKQSVGFRSNEQTITLRDITRQSLAFNTLLTVNYIDFKKAFNCVHRRDSL